MKMGVNRDSCVTGLRQDKNTWTKSQWLNERAHWFHQYNIYDQLMTIRINSHDVHTLVFPLLQLQYNCEQLPSLLQEPYGLPSGQLWKLTGLTRVLPNSCTWIG